VGTGVLFCILETSDLNEMQIEYTLLDMAVCGVSGHFVDGQFVVPGIYIVHGLFGFS
jgi:hypothetical protein